MRMRFGRFDFPTLGTMVFIIALVSPVRADDFANCMQGFARYNANLTALQNAREQCNARSDQIRADPTLSDDEKENAATDEVPNETGGLHRNSPRAGSRSLREFSPEWRGDDSNYASADQANGILKSLYDECTAQ